MRNQNKRQTNGLLAIIYKNIFLMYKAAYLLKHRCPDSIDNLKFSSWKNSENLLNIQNGG